MFRTCSTLSLLAATSTVLTFANSLDPDKDRHNVGLDQDPSCLALLLCSQNSRIKLESADDNKNMIVFSAYRELKLCLFFPS